MAETTTNRGKLRLANTDVSSADLRMLYFTGTQTGVNDPDLEAVADLEAVTGVAVAAERVALVNVTATEDDTADRAVLDADTVTFTAAPGVTAQGVAVYIHDAGGDSLSDLVGIYTTGFPQPVDGGLDVKIPNGFLRVS